MTKKPCAVYSIDRNSIENKEKSKDIVARIVWEINKGITEKAEKSKLTRYPFKAQSVKEEWHDYHYSIELYYKASSSIPDWRGFIAGISEKGSAIQEAKNKSSAYICFIYDDDSIFAISAGSGSTSVAKYADQMFGLEMLMKLIDEDSKVIKALRSRGITGNTLAAFQIFKKDQIILSQETYGQLYKEIAADLDFGVIATKLGIDIGNRPEANCIAKNSFKIGRSISFEELLVFIDHLVDLKKYEGNGFNVNRLEQISKRTQTGRKTIENLTVSLKKRLYKHLKNKIDEFSFEICHRDYEKYFFAEKYVLYHESRSEKDMSFDNRVTYNDMKNYFKTYFKDEFKTQKEFLALIDKVKLITFDEDGGTLTDSRLLAHLNGEVSYQEQIYFYIDNEWIKMKGDLVEELDNDVEVVVRDIDNDGYLNTLELPKWDKKVHPIEDNYNASFIGEENTMVFHKVLYKNIEMADIVKWDDHKVQMIHVKSGFDSSMRDLTSQIDNAARLLVNDTKGNKYKFAEKLYERLEEILTNEENKDYSEYFKAVSQQVTDMSKRQFVDLFRRKEIEFCLAVHDNTNVKDITNIREYNSNIAKLATLDLVRKMTVLGVPLYIEEISEG